MLLNSIKLTSVLYFTNVNWTHFWPAISKTYWKLIITLKICHEAKLFVMIDIKWGGVEFLAQKDYLESALQSNDQNKYFVEGGNMEHIYIWSFKIIMMVIFPAMPTAMWHTNA